MIIIIIIIINIYQLILEHQKHSKLLVVVSSLHRVQLLPCTQSINR